MLRKRRVSRLPANPLLCRVVMSTICCLSLIAVHPLRRLCIVRSLAQHQAVLNSPPMQMFQAALLRDDKDFVPTPKSVIFGHHFTSIAGTGPIVGPAIAVFWGWAPALLWVVFGAILIGGVHDMAALVISMRNRGQTLGEIAGRMISPRAKILFLSVLALALWIVLAIFGLVIATIFAEYPESVLSVWIAMPIAIGIGLWAHRGNRSLTIPSLLSLAVLYGAIVVGVYYLPIQLNLGDGFWNDKVVWTLILLFYCFCASVLPGVVATAAT